MAEQQQGGRSAEPARNAEHPKLIVASNRLPVSLGPDGWETSPGGLVAALTSVLQGRGGTWVGASGAPDSEVEPFHHDGIDLVPFTVTTDEHRDYYDGFSNATLWPLYHHWVRPPVLDEPSWWASFEQVNDRVAQLIADTAEHGSTVWVQDYQLQLVPQRLRRLRADLRIGFYLHIPFPPVELFQRLPWRTQILEGILGADVAGFQTASDVENFRAAVQLMDERADTDEVATEPEPGRIDTIVRADPISIDVDQCRELANDVGVQAYAATIQDRVGNPDHLLLGVDRLDYTKGILERLSAFDLLLRRHPGLSEHVQLLQVAVPSRESVEEYEKLRDEVERLVGRINGEHGELGRTVVHYHFAELSFDRIVALYLAADVLLVTPLADGMNLVAKEYVIARDGDPVSVVISEFAGAAEELAPGADVVNVFDPESIIMGIERAITRDSDEARRRSALMAAVVADRDVHVWAAEFLGALESIDLPGQTSPIQSTPVLGQTGD